MVCKGGVTLAMRFPLPVLCDLAQFRASEGTDVAVRIPSLPLTPGWENSPTFVSLINTLMVLLLIHEPVLPAV